MPQIIPYVVGLVANALTVAGVYGTAAVFIAKAAVYAAGMYLLNRASEALAPGKPKGGITGGIEYNYSGTNERRRILYGALPIGGMQTIPPFTTGNDGKLLHMVLTLGGHEFDDIDYVKFDSDQIADGQIGAVTGTDDDGVIGGGNKYAGKGWVRRYTGTAAQTADYILTQAYPSVFDANFRGRGIPYLALRFRFGEIYPGVPSVVAYCKGHRCYDPRSATTVWTSNPAIISRHYLLTDGGYATDDIDDATVIAAANICDQMVAIPTATTQKRYQCNLLLESAATPQEFEANLKAIVDTMRGRVVKRDGIWRVYAGAWDVPSITVAKSDWIAPFSIRVSAPPEERWNMVRVWYIDPEREYQRVECYPRRNTTYETDDGGDRIALELDLPGVTNEYEAQRHGEFALRASRNQLMITGRLRPEFFKLATWDTVAVTDDEYGWVSKGFRVAAMDLAPTGECDVTLVEEGSALWTDLAEGDYNAITTWPTIDPGASVPEARVNFVVTPQPAAIGFTWDKPIDPIPGEQTRLMEGVNNTLASATEVWRGDSTGVILHKSAGDQVTRYYWIQGVVGSYSGLYLPNSFGAAGAAGAWSNESVAVQLSLPTVALPATINGTVLDYSPAAGAVEARVGGVNVTTYASVWASSQAGCIGVVNSADNSPTAGQQKGRYQVTGVTSDIGMLWITAVYSSATHLLPFVVTKQKTGATGPIGPPGATIISNGLFNHVNTTNGTQAGWGAGNTPLASYTAGVDGGPCLWVPNSNGYNFLEHEEFIPVDPVNEDYAVSVTFRSPNMSVPRYTYFGLACYDANRNYLGYEHESWTAAFRLYSTSNSSAIQIHKPASFDLMFDVDKYNDSVSSYGRVLIPSYQTTEVTSLQGASVTFRSVGLVSVNTSNAAYDTLTLAEPVGQFAVDSYLGINEVVPFGSLGGTHKYFWWGNPTATWQTVENVMRGTASPWKRFREDVAGTLRHGTRYVRPMIYCVVGSGDGDLYVDNFVMQRWPRDADAYAGDGRIDASGRWRTLWNITSYSFLPIRWQPYSGATGGGAFQILPNSGRLSGSWVMHLVSHPRVPPE